MSRSTEFAAGSTAARWQAGDLAWRVRSRRHALGLTIEEVATRARMDPGFVEHLEELPTVLTGGALIRLADALDTTTWELLGAPSRRTPGTGPAATHAVLEPLGPTECLRLLERGGVGRVAATAGDRLVVLPVNYTVHDGLVVFRTSPSTVLARLADGRVSFEVDRIDDGMRDGWSVLVSGPARVLTEPDLHRVAAGVQVEPWAGGRRNLYVVVTPEEISGRRIHV
ncbi:MAG: helix-turn-helix domain-containing protein [Kribbellaceae bacterium]